jgi:hypothetical protein
MKRAKNLAAKKASRNLKKKLKMYCMDHGLPSVDPGRRALAKPGGTPGREFQEHGGGFPEAAAYLPQQPPRLKRKMTTAATITNTSQFIDSVLLCSKNLFPLIVRHFSRSASFVREGGRPAHHLLGCLLVAGGMTYKKTTLE